MPSRIPFDGLKCVNEVYYIMGSRIERKRREDEGRQTKRDESKAVVLSLEKTAQNKNVVGSYPAIGVLDASNEC